MAARKIQAKPYIRNPGAVGKLQRVILRGRTKLSLSKCVDAQHVGPTCEHSWQSQILIEALRAVDLIFWQSADIRSDSHM